MVDQKTEAARASDRFSHKEIIPWAVRRADAWDVIGRALRAISKRRQGGALSGEEQRNADELTRILEKNNLVVDYDSVEGWITRERDPKVDEPGFPIRRPR